MKKVYWWHLIDWRSVRKVVVMVSVYGVSIYILANFSKWTSKYRLTRMDNMAVGKISRIEEKIFRSQGRSGTRTRIIGYSIHYLFPALGKVYSGEHFIRLSSENYQLIDSLLQNPPLTQTVAVHFRNINPEQNDIDLSANF